VTNQAYWCSNGIDHEAVKSHYPPVRGVARLVSGLRGVILVGSHTYEITFAGRAGSTLRAEFDDCEVIVGSATTTLRAEVPDQAALWGIVQRIIGLGLQVIQLNLLASRPALAEGARADSDQSRARRAADADLT
jgi:hypothetical protein